MAYNKTEKVLAGIEARKNLFLAAAIDIISKHGTVGLTVNAVAEGSGQSVGLIYKYFPDLTELRAAVVQQQLDRDLAAIREAATGAPGAQLASALAVYYARLKKPKLVHALSAEPIYQLGISAEIAKLIRATLDFTPKGASLAAAGTLGALCALAVANDGAKMKPQEVLLFVLRGIGYTDAIARRIVERV